MSDPSKFSQMKLNLYFSTVSFALIIFLLIFADTIISNAPTHFDSSENHPNLLQTQTQTQTHQPTRILKITSARAQKILRPHSKLRPEDSRIFDKPDPTRPFDSRVTNFFTANQCSARAFMTWISPLNSFGEREFFALETLFQSNPSACLLILSEAMDSTRGLKILDPLTRRGFRVRAMAPNLWDLIDKTPAETWFFEMKNGTKNPGEIPLAQNLSNLMRLAVLYKYGGIYLDTDFIILKNLENLRNSIGAQSTDQFGNWTRLNNAVLAFDRNHPLLLKFLEEFASTFNGNIWGHNGPYLVSRVVEKVEKNEFNFTILPPMAFYPVPWTKVAGFFSRPSNRTGEKWVEAKIRQLNGSTYGVHLWNSQSSRLKIEEGSIIQRLISDHCVICSKPGSSTS